ncbi:MerR family transcriptional regulator [Pseudomonas sp. gcc21]|uniref:MerR family transcriptional regulator n=1 Tax=Pseudomonas sp. gcc21 TaxID=2726989 RepID=UPI001452035A|nr:MerR family transcriptional regulator [Pseudomonas sp. gcc21]QJD58382.1 MerR family transcriptional regulator [Pseudomonas sp. gcc21]
MTKRAEPVSDPIEHSATDELLPIREVVRLTGVNPVTLRAWERRYGLIQPVRTEGGHRLYSREDVENIRSIMSWTERGVAVSKVGSLLARNKPADSMTQAKPLVGGPALGLARDEWSEWQACVAQAVAVFDETRLEQVYGQLFSTYPVSMIFEEVLLPVWREQMHQSGFGQLSQWLSYDAFLRARVLQRLQLGRRTANGCVLLAALPESCPELELLVTGLLLGADDGAVRVLPAGQPLDELPLVCQSIQPEGLVLFAPVPPNAALLRQINKLALAVDCPLALAGVGAELAEEQLKSSPIANLGSESRLMRSRLAQFLAGRLDT